MKTIIISTVLLCTSAWAQSPVAVEFEPHHKTVFADKTLRVLDVVVPEEAATLDHTHNFDIATVCIDCAVTQTKSPGEAWSSARNREVGGVLVAEYAGRPAAHAVRNVGKGLYRLIAVENLRSSGWPAVTPSSANSATAPSEETRSFRVYDIRLTAGVGPTQHTHSVPTVVVLVAGDAATSDATKNAARRLSQPGEWQVVPAGSSHGLSAPYGRAAHLVEIEVR